MRSGSRSREETVGSKAISWDPSVGRNGEGRFSHKKSDSSSLNVEKTSLTKSLSSSKLGLDAVELVRSLRLSVTNDGTDGLSFEDRVDINRGDVNIIGDNRGSDAESDVGASGGDSVGGLDKSDEISSGREDTSGDLKDKVTGLR